MKKWLQLLTVFLLSCSIAGCGSPISTDVETSAEQTVESADFENSIETAPVAEEESDEPEAEKESEPETEKENNPETEIKNRKSDESAEASPSPAEAAEAEETDEASETEVENGIVEDGTYTSKDDVALYIHLFGHLPPNFITKKEAERLGWPGGSLEPYAPGMCIGGSRFGNYEGLLPEKAGRTYTECDIDTLGSDKRGAKRIVFSNDGLIYYTEDHYETFELLYGEETAD